MFAGGRIRLRLNVKELAHPDRLADLDLTIWGDNLHAPLIERIVELPIDIYGGELSTTPHRLDFHLCLCQLMLPDLLLHLLFSTWKADIGLFVLQSGCPGMMAFCQLSIFSTWVPAPSTAFPRAAGVCCRED